MATAARRRAVTRCEGWYGFFLDLDRTAAAIAELETLAREVDRPAALGPLEITISPPTGSVDEATLRRYEDLGVHRLVLVHDFRDLGRPPDAGARAMLLAEMTRTAEALRLR